MIKYRPLLILVLTSLFISCQTATPTEDDEPTETPEEQETDSETEEPTEEQSGRYTDPDDLYSVPVPENWTVDERETFTTLAGPDGGARVHLSAQETDDVAGAIAATWEMLDEPPELTIDRSMEPPAPQGVDEYVVIHYEMGDSHLAQAVGQRIGDTVYVALIDGEVAAIQRRAAALQTIITGFRPTALEEIDLSEAEPVALTDQHLEVLRAHVEESMESLDIPGASIGIVQNGEVLWEQGFGVREAGGDDDITPDTLMMIGSTTKTMTTLLLATLIDEGMIDWDTPVHEILPEFAVQDPELTEQITVENLVCACTGVPRRDMEIIFNYRSLTAETIIDSLETFEFFTDFGEAFQYSNQMVAAAGYVAAAALDSSYGELHEGYVEAMNERIFEPIGLNDTTISFDEATDSENFAFPHSRGIDFDYERFDLDIERFVEPLAPAGAAWSNTRDMNRYLLTMLAEGVTPDGERVVSEESLEKLWEPQVEISADDSYGLGWIISEHQGLEIISHGGNTMGYTSELAFAPDADVGITILANGGGANAFSASLRTRLIELLYEQPTRATEDVEFARSSTMDSLSELREELADELDREAIEDFLGRYEDEELGELTLEFEDNRLFLDAGEFRTEMRQKAEDDELILVTIDPPLTGTEFTAEMNEDDEPVLQFGEGLVAYTFDKID